MQPIIENKVLDKPSTPPQSSDTAKTKETGRRKKIRVDDNSFIEQIIDQSHEWSASKSFRLHSERNLCLSAHKKLSWNSHGSSTGGPSVTPSDLTSLPSNPERSNAYYTPDIKLPWLETYLSQIRKSERITFEAQPNHVPTLAKELSRERVLQLEDKIRSVQGKLAEYNTLLDAHAYEFIRNKDLQKQLEKLKTENKMAAEAGKNKKKRSNNDAPPQESTILLEDEVKRLKMELAQRREKEDSFSLEVRKMTNKRDKLMKQLSEESEKGSKPSTPFFNNPFDKRNQSKVDDRGDNTENNIFTNMRRRMTIIKTCKGQNNSAAENNG